MDSTSFYQEPGFYTPKYGQITTQPFPMTPLKRVLTASELLIQGKQQPMPATYETVYLRQFEHIAGSENLFPIFIELIESNYLICCKDSFIIMPIDEPSSYFKVNIPQMPTAFRASTQNKILYLGLQSGSIIMYDLSSRNTITTVSEFTFPVIQIEVFNKDTILAMDNYGNLRSLTFSSTNFMDKLIKVSVKVNDLVEQFRVKKRQKIKSFMKNLPFRKSEETNDNIDQNGQGEKKKGLYKFSVMHEAQRRNNISNSLMLNKNQGPEQDKQQYLDSIFPVAYLYQNKLSILTIETNTHKKIHEEILMPQSQINNQNDIGMVELGEGGFQNSNQTHIILVVSIANKIIYFRQIRMEDTFEFIRVTQRQHSHKILDGKFASNNLLIYLTQSGIQVSNVNTELSTLHHINFTKFGYIQFFNSEEDGFKVQMGQVYRNILSSTIKALKVKQRIKIEENEEKSELDEQQWNKQGNCLCACLQGKRIVTGEIYSWKKYLNTMAEGLQWEKCMKSALLIYVGRHTLLSGINEKIQKRNFQMKNFFQKITLTYLSYSLKNNSKQAWPMTIRRAIDFMVRTQSYLYLFSTIFQAIKSYKIVKIFMKELQQYIESGVIKCMTEEILYLTLEHYLGISEQEAKRRDKIKKQKKQKIKQARIKKQKEIQQKATNIEKEQEIQIKEKSENDKTADQWGQSKKDEILENDKKKEEQKVSEGESNNVPIDGHVVNEETQNQQVEQKVIQAEEKGIQVEQKDNVKNYSQQVEQDEEQPQILPAQTKQFNKRFLQTLFMNFDLTLMEKQVLLTICLNNELYQSLIHICKEQKDYITPLLKLCGLRVTKQAQNASKKQINIITDIIFWYLRQCLLHHMVSFDDDQAYYFMLEQLIGFIFIPGSLVMLLQASPEKTFFVINMLFGTAIMRHILQNSHRFFMKKSPFTEKYHIFQNHTNAQQFKIYEKMLSIVIGTIQSQFSGKKPSKAMKLQKYELQKFLTFLTLANSYPFTIQFKLRSYQFLISNPFAFEQEEENDKALSIKQLPNLNEEKKQILRKVQKSYSFIMRIINSIVRSCEQQEIEQEGENIEEKNKLMLRMYEKISIVDLDEDDERVVVMLQTKCYLLHELGRPLEVIDTFIKIKNQEIKNKVFQYLDGNLVIEGKMEKSLVFIGFASKLLQLFQINPNETIRLLKKIILEARISHPVLEDIINKFQNKPLTQLDLIQVILDKIKKQEQETQRILKQGYDQYPMGYSSSVKQKFTMKHLQIAVREKKENLEDYIMRIDYPLEQAYKICEQINNKSAMAFILVKSGRNIDGVLMMTDIFLATTAEGLGKMAKHEDNSLVEKMRIQLNQVLQTCQNEFKMDNVKGEQVWQKVAQKLFKGLNVKKIDSIPKKNIKDLLIEFSNKIFTCLFSQVSADFFIDKFSQNPKMFVSNSALYTQAHNLIYDRLCFRYEINSLAKQLFKGNQMKLYKNIYQSHMSGIRVDSGEEICQLCLDPVPYEFIKNSDNIPVPISKISICAFGCEHSYHSECLLHHERQVLEAKQKYRTKRDPSNVAEDSNRKYSNVSSSSSVRQQIKERTQKGEPLPILFCQKCKNQWNPILFNTNSFNNSKISNNNFGSQNQKQDFEAFLCRVQPQANRKKSMIVEMQHKLEFYERTYNSGVVEAQYLFEAKLEQNM